MTNTYQSQRSLVAAWRNGHAFEEDDVVFLQLYVLTPLLVKNFMIKVQVTVSPS